MAVDTVFICFCKFVYLSVNYAHIHTHVIFVFKIWPQTAYVQFTCEAVSGMRGCLCDL